MMNYYPEKSLSFKKKAAAKKKGNLNVALSHTLKSIYKLLISVTSF